MPRLRLLPPSVMAETPEACAPVLDHLMRRGGMVGIDTETTGLNRMRDRVLFWSMATEDSRWCFPAKLLPFFDPLFQRHDVSWCLTNATYDMHLLKNMGIDLVGDCEDILTMDALVDDTRPHGLKEQNWLAYEARWGDFKQLFLDPTIVSNVLGLDKIQARDFKKLGVGEKLLYVYGQAPHMVVEYASCDAFFTYMRWADLTSELASEELAVHVGEGFSTLLDYFQVIEKPLTRCLFDMERVGIDVDLDYIKKIDIPVREGIKSLEKNLCDLAAYQFNPNSHEQVRHVLYDDSRFALKAARYTKPKTGEPKKSTDDKTLEILLNHLDSSRTASKFIVKLQEHRKLAKLHKTYIKGISKHIGPDGKLHSNFKQHVARTGRLSCVASWTPVRTLRGDTPIADVVVGDYVWTHQGRWQRVLRSFTKGFGDMYDVQFSNGKVLTCTTDHKLLTMNGDWVRVGELIDELFKTLGGGSEESESGPRVVSKPRPTDRGNDHNETINYPPQCESCASQTHAGSRKEGLSKVEVLRLENRLQEPNERKERRSPSQLERGMSGWVRIPHLHTQRKTAVRSSNHNDNCFGTENPPRTLGSSPHRQRSTEQHTRQPSANNESRTQNPALFAGKGLPGVEIKTIHYRGSFEVFDLTVEEDASYEACGVLSHNSGDPNLQNTPRPDSDPYQIRGAFIASSGMWFIDKDYPQIEFRVAAVNANETKMLEAIHKGWDIHNANTVNMFGCDYDELAAAKKKTKKDLTQIDHKLLAWRQQSKTVGLGTMFGEGARKMSVQLGIDVNSAYRLKEQFFNTYPAIEENIAYMHEYGHAFESTYTMLGRFRRLHKINSDRKFLISEEERQAYNTHIQGSAAELIKLAMLRIHACKDIRELGGRLILTVHDELLMEAPKETASDVADLMQEYMCHPLHWGPINLDYPCPIDPDGNIGYRWSECH